MALYDGTRFIAPHSDCLDPNRPLSTLVEHIFRNDVKWLLVNGNWFTHGLWRQQAARDAATGDRAYASANWTCWHIAPYIVSPTLDTLEVVICGRVQTQAVAPITGSNKVTIRAELAGVGRVDLVVNATSNYEDFRLVIPVTNKPARPFTTQLRLWVKSEVTEFVGSAISADFGLEPAEIAGSGLYPNESGWPAPASGTYNEQATILADGARDHIYNSAEDRMIAHQINGPIFGLQAQRARLSYLQVRGFALREVYAPALYPQEEIRALIPLLGSAVGQVPLALTAAFARPQLVTLGPPGQLDYSRCTGADLPEGYTTPFQWRAITGTENYPAIVRQPLWLDEAACDIEIRILYVPVYVVKGYDAGTFETLTTEGADAEWSFFASLATFTDGTGDATGLEEVGATVAVTHMPTDRSGVWPFLLQRRWAAGALGDKYAPGDERPTYKEGQLFGPDFALLKEAVVRLRQTGAPTDKAVCLEVSAARTGALTIRTPTTVTDPDDPDRAQLVVVGMSVWVHYLGADAPLEPESYSGKKIADEAAIPPTTRFVVGTPGRSRDWMELGAQANRLWARRGARGPGRWFEEATDLGEPWVTQSTSYTAISSYTGMNERLSNFCGPLWMLHHVEPDSGKVRVTLEAHGRAIDLKVELYALDTGALLDTLTTSAADWELMTDTIELTVAQSHEGGSTANPKRLVLLKVEARTNGIGTTARLTYWQLREEPITDIADLPR